MTNFELYAAYYDLLYEDKRYDDEAAFVAQLIRDHAPGARSILELGCGTGKHALELAQRGFSVTGIDRSSGMVAATNARLPDTGLPASSISGMYARRVLAGRLMPLSRCFT